MVTGPAPVAPSSPTSCFLLQVFVWIGNEAREEEGSEAAASGETDRKSNVRGLPDSANHRHHFIKELARLVKLPGPGI